MAFCRLIVPLVLLSAVNAVHVPVLIWGAPRSSVQSNPLSPIPEIQFDKVLKEELQNNPFTLVFVEQTLSVEDFSTRNHDGESPYQHLRSLIGDAVYLPSVSNAVTDLNRFVDPEAAVHLKYTENGLSGEIKAEEGKFVFIRFDDAQDGESRFEMLSRHDDIMNEIYSRFQVAGNNVLAVYTGQNPSWANTKAHSRTRRQTNSTGTDHSLDGLRIDMDSIKVTTNNESITLTDLTSATSVFEADKSSMNTTLVYNSDRIVLNFKQISGYWYFDTVTLTMSNPGVTEELYPETEVFALTGFSYRCAQEVVFNSRNDTVKYSLAFEDLKIQPFFETTNATMDFGDSFNCVGFFSAPIWASLFVVFILLSITFYGIMMMMDIRTMDRFDDPKGKTITINAAE